MFSIIETNKVIGLVFWLWLSLTRLLRDYINYDTNQLILCFHHISAMIRHILQTNGNRNAHGTIWNVFFFHLEQCNKMIKIV